MKHPGNKIYPSLLITVLEKVKSYVLVREMGFEHFCSSFIVKLCFKTHLNKNIFETFNLRICSLV